MHLVFRGGSNSYIDTTTNYKYLDTLTSNAKIKRG